MPFQYSAEFRLRVCERLLDGEACENFLYVFKSEVFLTLNLRPGPRGVTTGSTLISPSSIKSMSTMCPLSQTRRDSLPRWRAAASVPATFKTGFHSSENLTRNETFLSGSKSKQLDD
jgi:hypothetical protein